MWRRTLLRLFAGTLYLLMFGIVCLIAYSHQDYTPQRLLIEFWHCYVFAVVIAFVASVLHDLSKK